MQVYYGQRYMELPLTEQEKQAFAELGLPERDSALQLFDFGMLDRAALSLKLDVGGSAYWSEISQMNTLDNLLTQGCISVIDYLERVPNGYISNQQELIETLKERQNAAAGGVSTAPAFT